MQDIGHLFRVVLVHLTAEGFDIQFFHMPFQVYNWGRSAILREITPLASKKTATARKIVKP
jgi:hypothetical protein